MGSSISNPPANLLRTKMITATRAAAAVTGDVAYTGVGFAPTAVIILAAATGGANTQFSVGICDENADERSIGSNADGNNVRDNGSFAVLSFDVTGTAGQRAVLKTLDADGFTLTWTKVGTPANETVLDILCLR